MSFQLVYRVCGLREAGVNVVVMYLPCVKSAKNLNLMDAFTNPQGMLGDVMQTVTGAIPDSITIPKETVKKEGIRIGSIIELDCKILGVKE